MIRRSITVRRTTRARHGDPATTSDHQLDGCLFAPLASSSASSGTGESDERGSQVTIGATLLAPADADLQATDQVLIDGVLWDVQGDPGRWASAFTGRGRGLQVGLRRTT